MIKKIGIIGMGTVGEAVIRSLRAHSALIGKRTGLKIIIKGVCDARKDKRALAAKLNLNFIPRARDLISDPEIDTVVELIGGISPAREFIVQALKTGKNVVTANKALLAESGSEIFNLAREKKKAIGFEASVCAAIPLIKSIAQGLVSCRVKKMYGILNGTTNYILDRMAQAQVDFSLALKEAQARGLAERRPDLDINGADTMHKLCILSYLCFGVWPSPSKVYVEGISKISLLDIIYAQELDYRIKLLAIAKKEKDSLELRVHPTLVPLGHPLADVSGAYNAVYLDTYPAGPLLFYGQGAGGIATSSAVISDIINISLGRSEFVSGSTQSVFKNIKDIKERYYIRLMAKDKPGVLAEVSKILAGFNISIASVNQKQRHEAKVVPIVMLTHEARRENLLNALTRIDELTVIKSPSQVIRIENL